MFVIYCDFDVTGMKTHCELDFRNFCDFQKTHWELIFRNFLERRFGESKFFLLKPVWK